MLLASTVQAYELPPSLEIKRTDVAPVIDGVMSETAWDNAAVIPELIQVEPVEGGTPTEETEVRIMHDGTSLFVGIKCFDSEPDKIIAKQLVEDVDMQSDDRINLVFDTFHDRRNAFFFQMNAAGARSEARIENSSKFRREWDGVWNGRTSIHAKGWTAEFFIPFQTLSFDPDSDTWGLDIERLVRRKNERLRWANISQSRSIVRVGDLGMLTGIKDAKQGLGLDVKPSLAVTHEWTRDAKDKDVFIDPSLDVFYRVTPSLQALLTLNTNFADDDVVARQTNITRFSLFFPETRDFFLRDAGIFEFGGLDQENGIPFFSRRIGIAPDGRPVDLEAGVKLTGTAGRWNIGMLAVQLDDHDPPGVGGEIDRNEAYVGRLSYNVLDESRIGVMFTHGDPTTDEDNTVAGLDARYRNSRLFGNQIITANAWFQNSWTPDTDGDEAAFGFEVEYPNDRINFLFGAREIQENFRPALGFVNRTDIRQYTGNFRLRKRYAGRLRTMDTGIETELFTDTDDELRSRRLRWNVLALQSSLGDNLTFNVENNTEKLIADFEIARGVTIAPGEYTFTQGGFLLESAQARLVALDLEIQVGDFYDGEILNVDSEIEFRPSPHFFFAFGHEYIDANLPEGDFNVHLSTVRLNLILNPNVSWTNFVQYDNVSDSAGINSRLRWIVTPGNELVLVWNQGYAVEDGDVNATLTQVTSKVEWTFRF